MSSDLRRPAPNLHRQLFLLLLAAASLVQIGCGYKKPPIPPPRKIPQRAAITVHQRGLEAIVTFDYPSLTISGTALSGVSKVEVWRLRQEVAAFAFDLLAEEEQSRREAEALLEEHGIAFGPTVTEDEAGADSDPEGGIPPDSETAMDPQADSAAESETVVAEDDGISQSEPPVEPTDESADEPDLDPADPSDAGEEAVGEELTAEEQLAIRIEAAQTLLRTPPTPMERYVSATESDFEDDAELILEVEGAVLASVVVGDQIVLRTPLPPPPPLSTIDSDREVAAGGDEDTGETDKGDEDDSEELAEDSEVDDSEAPPRDPLYGYLYSVKIYPIQGNASDLSPLGALFPVPPPPAPTDVLVTAEASGVRVDWAAEEDAEDGFRVYRREAQSRLYGDPVVTLPGSIRTHTDRTAIYGARYIYGVAAVARANPLLESELSSEHEVDYHDRFGPGTPTGLVAFPEVGRIRLLWDASSVPDLAGYRVRRRAEGADAVLVTEELVTRSQYVDDDVSSGQLWLYSVIAVDQLGNVSDASTEISVRVP